MDLGKQGVFVETYGHDVSLLLFFFLLTIVLDVVWSWSTIKTRHLYALGMWMCT